jgi:DNA-binding transcriptional ArsR family regulator
MLRCVSKHSMRYAVRMPTSQESSTVSQPQIASAAFLISDPARAAMLMALADGKARPAGELAHAGGVTAQTASTHLGKLLVGGLLQVEAQGRHRYFRLAGPQVAQALEALAVLGPAEAPRSRPVSPQLRELRFARRCYDHLAGDLGVTVTERLVERGFISVQPDKRYDILPAGSDWFGRIGLQTAALHATRHGLARQCLDWTERSHHLAGPLGAGMMRCLCATGYLRLSTKTRVVQVTPRGMAFLKKELGINASDSTGVRG